jgi:hypothetical protein
MKAQGEGKARVYESINRWKLVASFDVKGTSLPRKQLTVHNKLVIGCAAEKVWMLWGREVF